MPRLKLDRFHPDVARLVRGLAAYGSGEIATRIVRLLTVLVIARTLAPSMIGEAAIALTVFELVRVLARNGIGQAIIASPADRLAATCKRAHRLFWRWCWGLVAVQLFVAVILGVVFGLVEPGWMLALLALVYPMMPGGLVQVHLAMREGLVGRTARTTAVQTGADHVLTALLLLAWPSPFSLILPKVLTAPIWLVMTRRARPWRPDPAVAAGPIDGLVPMGVGVLGAELMTALRSNADNLIVAAMLGTTALGTYYFAYAAGLGIATSLMAALGNTLFPLLCGVAGKDRGATRKLLAAAVLAGAVPILVQAGAATFYVPIVFGPDWAFAAPLVAVLCLAALAQLAQTVLGCWLRASGRAPVEAAMGLLACIGALGGLFLGANAGSLFAAAVGFTAGQLVAAILSIALFAPALRSPATLMKGTA